VPRVSVRDLRNSTAVCTQDRGFLDLPGVDVLLV
jgi:hypothetical protein